MDYVTLGRTGLRVSVLGLGGGGHSRLGQRTGATEDESAAIVRRALALGVTFVDTAEAYGTEAIIGGALSAARREDVVLSTKKSLRVDGRLITAAELSSGLDTSLTRLRTDYVDIYHLHGVRADQYNHAVTELVPAMYKLRETIGELLGHGLIDRDAVDADNPFGFVRSAAESLPDAAYRFCRAEPGIHVVLSGTGSVEHLEANVASILRLPLPDNVRARLVELFARVDT